MSTPDIGRLDLSDSDSEDLFASPTKATRKPDLKPSEGTNVPLRNGESKYDAEQAREETLKRELRSVKSVNEVIEGVISSLESAKGNMDVSRCIIKSDQETYTHMATDGFADNHQCFDIAEYLDSHSLADRTQPTADLESELERRNPRCGRYRVGTSIEGASG